MFGRRHPLAPLLAVIAFAAMAMPPAAALSWRLFAGREECFSEWMPESQWKYVQKSGVNVDDIPVFVDVGFLVSSKYGTEESKAAVDYAIYNPRGEVIQSEKGAHEGEYGGHTRGGKGPWRVCFRVASGALLRPSVTVNLNYFYVNFDEFLHDGFDWEEEDEAVHINKLDPKDLGTREQIESLEHGLLRLDHYLLNVTHEQRYLYSRTVRHLRTAESTLRRTFWYYAAIYTVICLASFSQLVVVRMMFKKSRKQGLII